MLNIAYGKVGCGGSIQIQNIVTSNQVLDQTQFQVFSDHKILLNKIMKYPITMFYY